MFLVTQMLRQLRSQVPLQQSLGELLQQPRFADQIFRFLVVLNELVQKLLS